MKTASSSISLSDRCSALPFSARLTAPAPSNRGTLPKLDVTLELPPVVRLEDDSVCARWTMPFGCIAL